MYAVDALKRNPAQRTTHDVSAIKQLLLTTSFLASSFNDDGTNFEALAKLLRLEFHESNSEVFRCGSYGDKYYLILRGSVEITHSKSSRVKRIKDDLISHFNQRPQSQLQQQSDNQTSRFLTEQMQSHAESTSEPINAVLPNHLNQNGTPLFQEEERNNNDDTLSSPSNNRIDACLAQDFKTANSITFSQNAEVIYSTEILHAGDEFGEKAMSSSYPRQFTARTPSSHLQSHSTILAVLSKHNFAQVLRRSQLRNLHAELAILRSSYLLHSWTDHMLKDLYINSEVINVSRDQFVYKQSTENADAIFIILKGVFQVTLPSLTLPLILPTNDQINHPFRNKSHCILDEQNDLNTDSERNQSTQQLLHSTPNLVAILVQPQVFLLFSRIGQMTVSDVFGEEELFSLISEVISIEFTQDELDQVALKPSATTAIAQRIQNLISNSSQRTKPLQRAASVVCKNREGGTVVKVPIIDFLQRLLIFENSHSQILSQIEAKRNLHAATIQRISSTFPLCSNYLKSMQQPESLQQESTSDSRASVAPIAQLQKTTLEQESDTFQTEYQSLSHEPFILYRNKSLHTIVARQKLKKQQQQQQQSIEFQQQQYEQASGIREQHSFQKLNNYLSQYSTIGESIIQRKRAAKATISASHSVSHSVNSTIPIDEHDVLQQAGSKMKRIKSVLTSSISPEQIQIKGSTNKPILAKTNSKAIAESNTTPLISFEFEAGSFDRQRNQKLMIYQQQQQALNQQQPSRLVNRRKSSLPTNCIQRSSSIYNNANASVNLSTSATGSKERQSNIRLQQRSDYANKKDNSDLNLSRQKSQEQISHDASSLFSKKIMKLGYQRIETGNDSSLLFKNNRSKQLISKLMPSREESLDADQTRNARSNQRTTSLHSESMPLQDSTNCYRMQNNQIIRKNSKLSYFEYEELFSTRRGFKGNMVRRPQSQQSQQPEFRSNPYSDTLKAFETSQKEQQIQQFQQSKSKKSYQSSREGGSIQSKRSTQVLLTNIKRTLSPGKRGGVDSGNTPVNTMEIKVNNECIRTIVQPKYDQKSKKQFTNKSFI